MLNGILQTAEPAEQIIKVQALPTINLRMPDIKLCSRWGADGDFEAFICATMPKKKHAPARDDEPAHGDDWPNPLPPGVVPGHNNNAERNRREREIERWRERAHDANVRAHHEEREHERERDSDSNEQNSDEQSSNEQSSNENSDDNEPAPDNVNLLVQPAPAREPHAHRPAPRVAVHVAPQNEPPARNEPAGAGLDDSATFWQIIASIGWKNRSEAAGRNSRAAAALNKLTPAQRNTFVEGYQRAFTATLQIPRVADTLREWQRAGQYRAPAAVVSHIIALGEEQYNTICSDDIFLQYIVAESEFENFHMHLPAWANIVTE